MGERQMVEIARCLTMKTKILVLNEPTSSLTKKEVEKLFAMMRDLKAKGISIIFISHRLDEVFDICDRITVMRDGRVIDTLDADKTNTHEIVTLMIGRELSEMFARERVEPGKELLRVENLSYKEKFRNINFSVREGEIVGLYGLMGSGRSEIVRSIFGLDKLEQGNIYIDSNQAKIKRPSDAMEHGLGLITENRREEGLMLRQSVQFNLTVANLSSFVRNKLGFMDSKKEAAACGGNVEKLNIKTSSLKKLVQYLSGGNQQKVVIAKWLNRGPKVLMLDEPTRGVDVGAKYEIYSILSDLVKEGKGIFVISSEINEIMGLCDRILVIRKGRITKEFSYSEFKKDRLLEECMGGID
jgi:ribose transport system ATP-binding protein